ncbi:MAG: hypothetical protein KAG20_00475 [Cocleimonas sp.]|nr:hypothetical protein [Cocleimonas sp.]
MNTILAKLYQPLDVAIFSKESHGCFKLRSQAPLWLMDLMSEKELKTACYLDEYFPFLDCVLPDFEQHWDNKKRALLMSDIWLETDSSGKEIPLEASAAWCEGSAFILIKHLGRTYHEYSRLFQKVRDNALLQESLENERSRYHQYKKMREADHVLGLPKVTAFSGVSEK